MPKLRSRTTASLISDSHTIKPSYGVRKTEEKKRPDHRTLDTQHQCPTFMLFDKVSGGEGGGAKKGNQMLVSKGHTLTSFKTGN